MCLLSRQRAAGEVRGWAHLVWRSGMGREMHRKGSKVLLCFRQ